MFSGPQRGAGEPGGGVWQRHNLQWGGCSDGGANAEVVLGAPPSAGSRWGQIFGESVAMGTVRFGKGELKGGGAGDAKSEPPLPLP